jgi:pimeloyl-ACP methyl ester carboxylesterase/DNA-binding CsgD family transcriptional regulator
MTQTDPDLDDVLINHLYEIAVDPGRFDGFVDEWAEAAKALNDQSLGRHLDRAMAFLARLEPSEPDHASLLKRYDRFAAFIIAQNGTVEMANAGAHAAFGLKAGDRLGSADLSGEVLQKLRAILPEARTASDAHQILLRMESAKQKGSVLWHLQRLPQSASVLVVSTHFQWNSATDKILADAYGLTQAERHVVRLLVEGQDTKSISEQRQTAEGTTRGQIKSVISKMNLRSQTDIVRVTVMLGEMPGIEDNTVAKPTIYKNWLEQEVWKPFGTNTLPDGRRQTYHDMGPIDGDPVLLSHLGSCMVRWTEPMLRLAFEHRLRVICPIRAGYGQSHLPDAAYDPFELTSRDTAALLDHLGIAALPYVVQGSDYPLAAHFTSTRRARVCALISLGGRPCLPDGTQIEGSGAWQKFFVAAARKAPKVAEFAASAAMAMSRRIGPKAMLKSLCKESAADMSLLEDPKTAAVLEANITLMADKSSQAARAFANEYITFQSNWSGLNLPDGSLRVKVILADQDPTFDLKQLGRLKAAYPNIVFEVQKNAGLALLYQHYPDIIPDLARAARLASAPKN